MRVTNDHRADSATIGLPFPRYSGGEGRGEGASPLPRVRRKEENRSGFTLIEMLVVIAIILTLAAMMVAVSPGVSTRQQASRGAALLQGQLLYARSRAKMNMLPTGVLLGPTPTATSIQLIQSGLDFGSGTWSTNYYPGGLASWQQGNTITLVDGNGNPVSLPPGAVNGGDYLEMAGSGVPHLILTANNNTIKLASNLPTGPPLPKGLLNKPLASVDLAVNNLMNIPGGVSYRVMRSPRALIGEEPVQMPSDVGIDLLASQAFIGTSPVGMPNPPQVLFTPSGALLGGPGSGYDIVCFVVRDISLPYPQGFPTIIAVYGKTGFITAHPVNTNPQVGGGNPFYFALHARSSGM